MASDTSAPDASPADAFAEETNFLLEYKVKRNANRKTTSPSMTQKVYESYVAVAKGEHALALELVGGDKRKLAYLKNKVGQFD